MRIALSTILLLLAPCANSLAQGWRGIVPLRSTRADVERILGPPAQSEARHESSYELDEEFARVDYAAGLPCDSEPSRWKVSKGTVVRVTVSPKANVLFSDLKINLSGFEAGVEHTRWVHYVSTEEGIQYSVSPAGTLGATTYFPPAKDDHLRCPDTRPKPPQLFSSGKLTAAGKELLDSFMQRLKGEPGARGLINLDLEGKRVDEAETIVDSVIDYVKQKYGAEFDRLTIIEGYRYRREMELLIEPSGGKELIPFPDGRRPTSQ